MSGFRLNSFFASILDSAILPCAKNRLPRQRDTGSLTSNFSKTGLDVYLGAPLNVFFAPLFWILILHCPENGCKGDEALDLHLIIRMHLKCSSLPLPKLAARIRNRQTSEALTSQTSKKNPWPKSFHDVAIARLGTIQQSTHAPTPSSFQTPNKGLNRQNPASTPFAQREFLSASVERWQTQLRASGPNLGLDSSTKHPAKLKLSYYRGLIDPKSLKLTLLGCSAKSAALWVPPLGSGPKFKAFRRFSGSGLLLV